MEQEGIDSLAEVLSKIQDKDLIREFLYQIHTPAESRDLSLRWELVRLLDEGVSQRDISSRLGISLCKITRGSKELKKTHSAIKDVLVLYQGQDGS
ncbi:MAG: Trp family transcriptional regulator [Thermodesulfobacteriota bacterium]|nr:Trp family transcriptional regulator [Thermodesulfobacteriota bacterium]